MDVIALSVSGVALVFSLTTFLVVILGARTQSATVVNVVPSDGFLEPVPEDEDEDEDPPPWGGGSRFSDN